MFAGSLMVIGAIVVLVMGLVEMPSACVVIGEGLLTAVFGVRGALITNVPARVPKLVSLALITLVIQVACVGVIVYLTGVDGKKDIAMVCGCSAVALLSLIVWVLSRSMAKKAER